MVNTWRYENIILHIFLAVVAMAGPGRAATGASESSGGGCHARVQVIAEIVPSNEATVRLASGGTGTAMFTLPTSTLLLQLFMLKWVVPGAARV